MRKQVREGIRKHNTKLTTEIIRQMNSTKKADKILNIWKNNIIAIKRPDGSLCRDRHDILKIVTDFYRELYSSKISVNIYLHNRLPSSDMADDITESEVFSAIRELKTDKSPGTGQISNELLKYAANILSSPLSELFTKYLHVADVPKSWKNALIILIRKKGDPIEL